MEGGPKALIKLKADDDDEVEIVEPIMTAYPRGRPTKKRIESLVRPKKKRRCGKCKKIVDDHDARNCKGVGEVSASQQQHHRPAATEAAEEFSVQELEVPSVVAVEVRAPRPQRHHTALAVQVPAPTGHHRRKPSARAAAAAVTASTVSSRAKRKRG